MCKFNYFLFISCIILKVLAVPPSKCHAEFRWEDCGKPPKAVMYYWKPGSRCEIGLWKGCLPSPNMFADEYDCINTCVFVDRPAQRTETTNWETSIEAIVESTTATVDNNATVDDNGTVNNATVDDNGTVDNNATINSTVDTNANATQETNKENQTTAVNETENPNKPAEDKPAEEKPTEDTPVEQQ